MQLIYWSRLMRHEHSTRALVELMQIGKTPSGADPVFHHTPETFHGIEMVAATSRQERPLQLLVPVCQRRRELVRPMNATAVGHHHDLFPSMAQEGHHLMDVLTQSLRIKMGHDLIADSGGAILDGANHTEQHTTGHPAPTPIADPRLAFEVLFAFEVAGA